MSCDAAALALTLRLASYRPDVEMPRLIRAAASARPPAANPLAREPLFASIVSGAGRLRDRVDGLRKGAALSPAALAKLDSDAAALAELDMKGHTTLAARGTDGDLKCILKGIAQDLPRKTAALASAADASGRKSALDELWFLLRDNVEVVTAPTRIASTDTVAG